ncbi:MAG: T9SS type A sorting domain-containing protein, partial [Candidatus Neomarinimicrobiota bacterium]|nr:T9SS type A sorting domain-containing protein [Candidatus Neomarinimicrobiota bacterium]
CDGPGIADGTCDCAGNTLDCAGVCGGSSLVDECGVCDGNGPEENFDCEGNCLVSFDCADVCGGSATVDNCGTCDADSANDCYELDISYEFKQVVSGFQFDLSGLEVEANSATGGDAATYLDVVQNNGSTVIGLSTSGATMPVGSGVLTTLTVVGDLSGASIANLVVTDVFAQQVESSVDGLTLLVDCLYNQGDVNSDYSVDVLDVVTLVNHILQYADLTECEFQNADYNTDGVVNVVDAVFVVQSILGSNLAKGEAPSYIEVSYNNSNFSIDSDGKVAGIQLEYTGELNITDKHLPEDWKIDHNNKTILIYSLGGSNLVNSKVFEHAGDFEIISAIGTGWNGLEMNVDLRIIPESYSLYPAYPNPFNPITNINYQLPIDGNIILSIYNIDGEKLEILESGIKSAGNYTVQWNAVNYSSGLYFVKMEANGYRQTEKLMLVK